MRASKRNRPLRRKDASQGTSKEHHRAFRVPAAFLLYLTAVLLADYAAHEFGDLLSPVGVVVLPAASVWIAFRRGAHARRDAIGAGLRMGVVYGFTHQAIVLFRLFYLGVHRSQLPGLYTGSRRDAALTIAALVIDVVIVLVAYLAAASAAGLVTHALLSRYSTHESAHPNSR